LKQENILISELLLKQFGCCVCSHSECWHEA